SPRVPAMMLTGHFDITEWVDYVRAQVAPIHRSAMSSHLESGCPRCNREQMWLSRLAEICAEETAGQVPKDVERLAKTYPWHNKPTSPNAKRLLWATLLYDSLSDAQPVGLRSGHQAGRQALFQAGDYSVDVRFENLGSHTA